MLKYSRSFMRGLAGTLLSSTISLHYYFIKKFYDSTRINFYILLPAKITLYKQ